MIKKEDREFQLNLAKIQTYFELLIAIFIGVFGTFVSFSIYASGMYNTLPASNPIRASYGAANASKRCFMKILKRIQTLLFNSKKL